MKPFIKFTILILLLCPVYSFRYKDDTAKLQNMLNNGSVILPAGRTYNVTGLTVTHNLNLNGSTIHLTSNTGAALRLMSRNISVTNGTISGVWNINTPGTFDGASGIVLYKDNATINKVHVTGFSAYGIVAGPPVNNPVVTNCLIEKTGVIGFFIDSESANTKNGTFSNNVVDRSMQPASMITEPAVAIRGSTDKGTITSDWIISKNIIKMPALPKDWSAECMEIRYIKNSTVNNNSFTGGSIGVSVVRGTNVTVSNNRTFKSKLEGIEFADCNMCFSKNNSVNGSTQEGILIDGEVGSTNIQIIGDTVKNTVDGCIHSYKKTKNLTISNCVLFASSKAIDLQNSSVVNIKNNKMYGRGIAKTAVMIDTCPGNVVISGGSMENFITGAVTIYSRTTGQVTDNVLMSGVTVTKTPPGLTSYLENGAVLGGNINIK